MLELFIILFNTIKSIQYLNGPPMQFNHPLPYPPMPYNYAKNPFPYTAVSSSIYPSTMTNSQTAYPTTSMTFPYTSCSTISTTTAGNAPSTTSTVDSENNNNLVIISINTHVNRDTLENAQIEKIVKLAKDENPTFLPLQGATKELYNGILNKLKNYDVACKTSKYIDIRYNKKEFLPILYNKDILYVVSEQNIGEEFQNFGCLVTFVTKKHHEIFSIANVDLYSVNEKKTDRQMAAILTKFKNTKFSEYPIFVTGTINNMGYDLRQLVNDSLLNLVMEDKNNAGVSKTTFHNHGTLNDNVQRDFILLNDEKEKFKLISAQIMTNVSKNHFEHYPVFTKLEQKIQKSE